MAVRRTAAQQDADTPSDAAPDPAVSKPWRSLSGELSIGHQRLGPALKNLVPVIAIVLLVVIFSVGSPAFLSVNNGITVATQSAVLLIISVGAAFVILIGSIDLSVGATASVAGILAAKFAGAHGAWGLLIAVLAGCVIGAVNGGLFTILRIPSFLVTLGTFNVLSGLGLIITNSVPVSVQSTSYQDLAGVNVIGRLPVLVVWAIGILLLGIGVGSFTRYGRVVYAIGGGEKVARLSGIPVNRYKLYTFIVSGALAGLGGGLLTAYLAVGGPSIGQGFMLQSIAAVVMGGIPLNGGYGNLSRTLLGVLVLSVLTDGMNIMNVNIYYQSLIEGIVIIVAVAFSLNRSRLDVLK
jgi:ribose transport system permease protein/putative xylitol transport system permease protein